MTQIFISHSSRDKSLVRELSEHFPPWLTTWIDEERLLIGSNLERTLQSTINCHSDYILLFLGDEAINSEWVKREIEWALQKEMELDRVMVLPVLLADVTNELHLIGLHDRTRLECLDFSREGIKALSNKITNHVAGWLSQRLRDQAMALPRGQTTEESPEDIEYHQVVHAITSNLAAVPKEWRSLVKSLILIPTLSASTLSRRGDIPLTSSQYYQRILTAIGSAQEGWEIFAVSTLSSDLWSGDTNQRNYARRNLQAVERGAVIRRLFIVPGGKAEEYRETIQKQQASGVDVRVANTRLLARNNDLEDLVIFRHGNSLQAYICYPAIDDPRKIRSGRLIVDPNQCSDLVEAFQSSWDAALDVEDFVRSERVELSSQPQALAPGRSLQVHQLSAPVVTCEEAAAARGIPLARELKTLILETSSGLIAVHLPGDGILSLRAVKDFIEAQEARLTDPETLSDLKLSAGTVSALLDPVWSMPQLISRRIFTFDQVATNNGTKVGYFLFDPLILTRARNVRIGEFEAKHGNL